MTTNGIGTHTGRHYYTAYDHYRGGVSGSELSTANRFTGQQRDDTAPWGHPYYYMVR